MPPSDPDPQATVDTVLATIRRRRNRVVLLHAIGDSLLVTAAAVLLIGLVFIADGAAVPPALYAGAGIAALVLALVLVVLRRCTVDEAARLADHHFDLADGIVSYRRFAAQFRRGGFYALQARQLAAKLQAADARTVPAPVAGNRLSLAALLLVVSAAISLVPESEERRQEREERVEIEHRTAVIKELLGELIDQQEWPEGAAGEHGQLVERLEDLVEEIEATDDRETAMREYARLQRELEEMQAAMTPREEEELIAHAAKELQKSPDTAEIGDKLEDHEFDEAAEALTEEMKKVKRAELDAKRKELAKLKAAAQRMAAAAKARSNRGAGKGGQEAGRNAQARAGKGAGEGLGLAGGGAAGAGLGRELEGLDEAAAVLDEELAKALRDQRQLGELTDEELAKLKRFEGDLDEALRKVDQRLRDAQDRWRLAQDMRRMQRQVGKLRSALNGEAFDREALLAMLQGNGLEPGWGSVDSGNDQQDPDFAGGVDRITGQKGSGPSAVSVEEAESGTGVASRPVARGERTFARQVESYVQRDDVPEPLKQGVKRYFQSIHQGQTGAETPE